MNLRHLAQTIDIEHSEAVALKWSLETYQQQLLTQSTPLTILQLLSIKPTTRVLTWLARAIQYGTWPTYGPKRLYMPRPRKLRLEVDELLLLRSLHQANRLPDQGLGTGHRLELFNVLAKVDQQAVSLPHYFQLA